MRGFKDQRFDENSTFNVGEILFCFHLDDEHKIDIEDSTEVEYMDLVRKNMVGLCWSYWGVIHRLNLIET